MVQTLVVVVNNGTIFCIQNMHVAAICTEQGHGLGTLLQKLQVQKHSLILTRNISAVSILECTAEEEASINLVYTDIENNLYSVDLGSATYINIGDIHQLGEKCVCNDFYLLSRGSSRANLCLALLNEEVLVVIDVADSNKILTRLKLVSKVQKILSVAQHSAEMSGSGEKVASLVVILAPRQVTGSEGVSTQIVWIGQTAGSFKSLHLGTAPFLAVVATGQQVQLSRVEGEPQEQQMLVLAITERDVIVLRFSASMQTLLQSVASTSTQFAANGGAGADESASSTPVEVLIHQALLSLVSSVSAAPLNTATFDHGIQRFASMTNGGEVLALLTLLLEIPHPPAGYLQKYLFHAEVGNVLPLAFVSLCVLTNIFLA